MATHRHPMKQDQIVEGERLKPGDHIQKNDVYDSTSGKWEKAPPAFVGLILEENYNVYWVRLDSSRLTLEYVKKEHSQHGERGQCAFDGCETEPCPTYREQNENHKHPLFPHRIIQGRKLNPGEIIRADDVYDSTSGRWEKAPCPGIVLQDGYAAIWVRPSLKT